MIDQRSVSANEQRKFTEAGIGRRHLPLLLGKEKGLIETTSLGAARRFLADERLWCLTLLGGHGAGKTMAAEWLVVEAALAGLGANDGARQVITPFGLRDAAFDPEERRRLQQRRVLVVDDLGCEGSDRDGLLRWVVFEILDHRWRHCRKTVITSNLGPSAFQRFYGRRVTERLTSAGLCISIAGPNLRRTL